jgi:hypothetical protein
MLTKKIEILKQSKQTESKPCFSSCFMEHGLFKFQYDYMHHWVKASFLRTKTSMSPISRCGWMRTVMRDS